MIFYIYKVRFESLKECFCFATTTTTLRDFFYKRTHYTKERKRVLTGLGKGPS